MQAIEGIRNKVKALEARLEQLEATGAKLDEQFEALKRSSDDFDRLYPLEAIALGLDLGRPSSGFEQNSLEWLASLLGEGSYERIVYESKAGTTLFAPLTAEDGSFEERTECLLLEGDSDTPTSFMFVGAALLLLYIQANWTGPPVKSLSDPAKYPLPFMPRESEIEGDEDALAKLEREARATSAASGKDKTIMDLDTFPKLHAKVASEMEVNGEFLVESIQGTHFLQVAWKLLSLVNEHVRDQPITIGWWLARCATAYQESLQSRDVAYDLRIVAEQSLAKCRTRLTAKRPDHFRQKPSQRHLGMLVLEQGVIEHKFKEPLKAKQFFNDALKVLELKIELSGALGKRTKFQVEEKTQLVLLATSERTKPAEAPKTLEITPQQEGEAAGFGTQIEAGHVKVKIEEVDDTTPLHERLQITPTDDPVFELKRKGHLDLIDQVAILDLCIDVKNSYAMERLTAEEMLAYCERVTENPDNWTIHGCALLIKSKLEFERWKTKERSVLQMQMLVDQQTDRLTPLQYRQKDIVEDSAPITERIMFLHSLIWPPVWRLKRGLADRYREVGVMMSAMNLYQELRMWDDVVACLVQLDKRHRAETLIRERLAIKETPSLLVTLGELIEDESFLERAWVISNRRYARAKRLLGAKAYERGEYNKAKEHLTQALAVNAQFPWAWFRLGAAAMRTEDWLLAKKAYARVVSLEPEDAEGWGNLSGCLLKLGDIEQAFRAIEEATKYGFENGRIWDSYLTLALAANKMDQALLAVNTLIEINGRKSGAPKVDVRAFLSITEHAIREPRFRIRYEQLIATIKARCQSQADVWALVSEYYSALGKLDEKRDALLRRCRAIANEPNWTKDLSMVNRIILSAIALASVTISLDVAADKRETAFFVRNMLEKAKDWKELPAASSDAEKQAAMEEKVNRLQALLRDLEE